MTTETKVREQPDFAELDAEREVDLKRYWNRLVRYWWLPLAGLIAGLVIGYLLSVGGNQVYKATTLIYLGQPISPNGTPIQSIGTNPNTVEQIIHSEAATDAAATTAGLRSSQVRGHVSSKTVTGAKGSVKAGQVPLIQISVTGSAPRKKAIALASDALANQVITRVSPYVDVKIATTKTRLKSLKLRIASVQNRVTALNNSISHAGGLSPIEQLTLISQADNAEQQLGTLLDTQAEQQQLLALSEQVEKPRIVEPGVALKTTARSTRNSLLVGAVIGLLLGLLAALVWEPLATRFRRA
jgi:uncharacterized protein involved in exopolysaccharide biosynthesis